MRCRNKGHQGLLYDWYQFADMGTTRTMEGSQGNHVRIRAKEWIGNEGRNVNRCKMIIRHVFILFRWNVPIVLK